MKKRDRPQDDWLENLTDTDSQRQALAARSLYESYHPVLWALGRTRTDDSFFLKDVLCRFWQNMARGAFRPATEDVRSPLVFLLVSFNRFLYETRREKGLTDTPTLTEKDMEELYSGKLTPEQREQKSHRRQALGRALTILGEIAPEDANLSFQYLSGADLKRIAASRLAGNSRLSEDALGEEEKALSKRLLDRRTGALARLKILIDRFHAKIPPAPPAFPDAP